MFKWGWKTNIYMFAIMFLCYFSIGLSFIYDALSIKSILSSASGVILINFYAWNYHMLEDNK